MPRHVVPSVTEADLGRRRSSARPLFAAGGALPWIGDVGIAALASIVLFGVSIVALPIVVARLPEDHFVRGRPRRERHGGSLFLLVVRNVVGAVLLLAGIAMLVAPGPGVVTILASLAIMEFPGKVAIERRIVSAPHVLPALNRLRSRAGKPPLRLE